MEIDKLYELFLAHPTISTDSRDIPDGALFFALKGETFNGNAFAAAALEKGAAYAIIDEPEYADPDTPRLILVDDALRTLQQLATHHRLTLGTPVIGVTGTNGKTTTKELVAAVLSKKYRTLYTQGNFNNHIGVPKTLLQLTPDHQMAVVEMGANHPGEIDTLVRIARPDYGIITNVGKAHLLGFGSFEGVVRTKGELYDYLRETQGTVFINNDNPYLCGISNGLHLVRYAQHDQTGTLVSGQLVACDPTLQFQWRSGVHSYLTHTQLVGSYNLDNALAAICIGIHFGVSEDDICEAISTYKPSNNRSQLTVTARNRLVVDAYNANPTSMAAALENFRLMKADRKMCILGDMKELGGQSAEEHQKIVNTLLVGHFETVWLVGDEFAKTDRPASFRTFPTIEELKTALADETIEGRTILIKGSNSTRLVQAVPLL